VIQHRLAEVPAVGDLRVPQARKHILAGRVNDSGVGGDRRLALARYRGDLSPPGGAQVRFEPPDDEDSFLLHFLGFEVAELMNSPAIAPECRVDNSIRSREPTISQH
jgi:hypothetical protein